MGRGAPSAARPRRRSSVVLFRAAVAGLLLFVGGASAAFGDNTITRVEEDWELVVGEPLADNCAPQVINVISPTGNLSGKYGIFELNHRTCGDYGPGGMQLQIWEDETLRGYISPTRCDLLNTPSETVTYTVKMSALEGTLSVEVKNGNSTTWGQFGGDSSLRLATSTSVNDLSGYDPALSVSSSRIGYAQNRVVRFVQKEVRYYSYGTLISTDTTRRVVYERTE